MTQQHASAQVLLNVPAEEYQRRELGVASSGVLQRLRTMTLAHLKAWSQAPDDEGTPALLFGRAYHCRMLEPEVFAQTYCDPPPADAPRDLRHLRNAKKPGESTLESIAFWDAWDAEHAGLIPLSRESADLIEEMHHALMQHELAASILRSPGDSEVTMRWVDEETGVPCKARIDRLARRLRLFGDLKTAEDASPSGFAKSVVAHGYHIQAAHYLAGGHACGLEPRGFPFIVQEKSPPYLPAVHMLDDRALARGAELRERGLAKIAHARTTNTWPGYNPGITEISLPEWAFKD